MTRRLAFLSGAPRVSTKRVAAATGARQHILGTIAGFRANGWELTSYVVGDMVPEAWLEGGLEKRITKSFFERLAADAVRIVLSVNHTVRALRNISAPDWVYERCGALQLMGYFFQRRGSLWILETNSVMFDELVNDRKSIALTFLVRWVEEFAYRKCDILVVVSEDLKGLVVQKVLIPPDKIVVLPNAADTETFNPDVVKPHRIFAAETLVIGFQGSMYKWAGLEYLVRAISALRQEGLDVAAVLLGDGQERQNLEKLTNALGMSDYVTFPGLVPREQVPEYIAGFDLGYSGQINLSTNVMYLSPLKLYDYMAMGKAVIASRFADAVKLTKDGQIGYLFNAGDLEDLMATVASAYRERANLAVMGAAARSNIVANHSWSRRIRDFITTADAMLAKRSSRRARM